MKGPDMGRWSSLAQCVHKVLVRERQFNQNQRQALRMGSDVREERRRYTDGFEDGGRDYTPRKTGGL